MRCASRLTFELWLCIDHSGPVQLQLATATCKSHEDTVQEQDRATGEAELPTTSARIAR